MNSFFPPQIGYIPTGTATTLNVSTIYLGRDITQTWEAIGFGAQGRPDYLQVVQIPLTNVNNDGSLTQKGSITLNVAAIISGAVNRPQFPANINLNCREVLVCNNGVTQAMLVIGSAPYPTGAV